MGFFNQLFVSFNDPRRVDQNAINQLLINCDMNRDGQVTKPELFVLFKKVLTGDTSAYNNLPQQQQNYGGNMYGQNQYNPNQYPGNNQYQNQGNNQYQNPYQGGNQFPGNNQYGNPNQQYNQQQQPSFGNKQQQQPNNQWGNGQYNQGPKYY